MKILHVITKLELGGAQQHALFVCRRLAERGHDVVLASGPGGLLDAEAHAAPFRHVVVPSLRREVRPWSDLAALVSLVRLIRRLRPDVVQTHSSKAGVLGRLAGRLGGVRAVIHTVQGWSFSANMPAFRRVASRSVERLLAPTADHFACVSRRDLEVGERAGIVQPGRGSVIRMGIDRSEFSPDGLGRSEVRDEWKVADAHVLVINVSCLKPQKAPLDYVMAAARAAREEASLRFALVGDGELRPDVERAVRDEGLEGRFVLAGWRRDVPRIMRAADVVALTSLWEGLPRVLIQARVAGRPVVATSVNGSPEVVEDGVTGLLVPPHDIDAISGAFVRLARDARLRRAMGARAPRGIDAFDQERMVLDHEELYLQLLREAR